MSLGDAKIVCPSIFFLPQNPFYYYFFQLWTEHCDLICLLILLSQINWTLLHKHTFHACSGFKSLTVPEGTVTRWRFALPRRNCYFERYVQLAHGFSFASPWSSALDVWASRCTSIDLHSTFTNVPCWRSVSLFFVISVTDIFGILLIVNLGHCSNMNVDLVPFVVVKPWAIIRQFFGVNGKKILKFVTRWRSLCDKTCLHFTSTESKPNFKDSSHSILPFCVIPIPIPNEHNLISNNLFWHSPAL